MNAPYTYTFENQSFFLWEAPFFYSGPPVQPMSSERCFELPLARWYCVEHIRQRGLLEIGAVTPYYFKGKHGIIDIADPVNEAIHVDVRHIRDFKNKHVLSISTFEHVEPIEDSIRVLKKIVEEAASYLITIPIGEFPAFDAAIQAAGLHYGCKIYRRRSLEIWEEDESRVGNWYTGHYMGYNSPYGYATTVAVLYKGSR